MKILDFSDNLNILSKSLEGALGLTSAFERAAIKVGIRINMENTKMKEFLNGEHIKTT